MLKYLAPLVATILVSACSAPDAPSDYDLQWDMHTARLAVLDENGKPIDPFAGTYVGVEGFVFSHGVIRLHPGKHRIQRMCPTIPGQPVVLDVAQSVTHDFKAGQRYELVCKDGWPVVHHVDTTAGG